MKRRDFMKGVIAAPIPFLLPNISSGSLPTQTQLPLELLVDYVYRSPLCDKDGNFLHHRVVNSPVLTVDDTVLVATAHRTPSNLLLIRSYIVSGCSTRECGSKTLELLKDGDDNWIFNYITLTEWQVIKLRADGTIIGTITNKTNVPQPDPYTENQYYEGLQAHYNDPRPYGYQWANGKRYLKSESRTRTLKP